MTLGQVQINGSVFQGGVAQQKLDRPQIGSGFHQMGGEAMTKGVGANRLVQASAYSGFAAGVPNGLIRDGFFHAAVTQGSGKQIDLGPLPAPVLA